MVSKESGGTSKVYIYTGLRTIVELHMHSGREKKERRRPGHSAISGHRRVALLAMHPQHLDPRSHRLKVEIGLFF